MTADPAEARGDGPVIRDRRRVDPVTGELRERQETAAPGSAAPGSGAPGSAASGAATPEASDGAPADAEAQLLERTADLQRLQAEYLNYKRRVDRDREQSRTNAIASTLASLLPVLDDVARAREHEGELTGGFKAVAESFEGTVGKLGLTSFGAVGDEFDPRIHEALMHSFSEDVSGPTCQAILQVGYSIGERILRPARVAVAEPPPASTPAGSSDGATDEFAPAAADVEGAADSGDATVGDMAGGAAPYDDNGSSQDGNGSQGAGA